MNQPLHGLGAFADRIYFQYFSDNSSIDYDFHPGKRVNTNWKITAATHTDRQTMKAVEAEIEKDESVKRAVSTSYYFDDEGNCKKLIHIPRSTKDERPSARSVDGRMKYVEAEMEPGDFELAAFILERFEKLVSEAVQRKHNP